MGKKKRRRGGEKRGRAEGRKKGLKVQKSGEGERKRERERERNGEPINRENVGRVA